MEGVSSVVRGVGGPPGSPPGGGGNDSDVLAAGGFHHAGTVWRFRRVGREGVCGAAGPDDYPRESLVFPLLPAGAASSLGARAFGGKDGGGGGCGDGGNAVVERHSRGCVGCDGADGRYAGVCVGGVTQRVCAECLGVGGDGRFGE